MRHITGPDAAFPSTIWLRSHRADPPVVLVIAPDGGAAPAEDPTGEQLASALFGLGFAPVIDPDAALPRIPRLAAHREGDRLLINDHHCDLLFQAALEPGRPWPRAAEAGRRIGVLFVAGEYPLSSPTGDHRQALTGAASAGHVIGGTVRLAGADSRRPLGIRRPRWLGGAPAGHPTRNTTRPARGTGQPAHGATQPVPACPDAASGASWSP